MINFDEDNEPYEEIKLNIDLIKSKIPTHSSKKLCEMIVTGRYFGFNEDIDVYCMEELAKRRINGDLFEFESYIDEAYKELPTLDFSLAGFDIRQVLNQVIGNKK
jgi:hypothetical protein